MARPNPTVILSHTDDALRHTEICQADAIFAVCYRGEPIQMRVKSNVEVEYPGWKYAKVAYPNSGHAFNLAERLNQQFRTQDFAVYQMTTHRVLKEKTS